MTCFATSVNPVISDEDNVTVFKEDHDEVDDGE